MRALTQRRRRLTLTHSQTLLLFAPCASCSARQNERRAEQVCEGDAHIRTRVGCARQRARRIVRSVRPAVVHASYTAAGFVARCMTISASERRDRHSRRQTRTSAGPGRRHERTDARSAAVEACGNSAKQPVVVVAHTENHCCCCRFGSLARSLASAGENMTIAQKEREREPASGSNHG